MKKTISVLLLSSIISTTVLSTPLSLFAAEKPSANSDSDKIPPLTPEQIQREKDQKEGAEAGAKLGMEQGEKIGGKDASSKLPKDLEKRFNELGNIIPPADAGKSKVYLDAFKNEFKRAFVEGYMSSYDSTQEEIENKEKEDGKAYGGKFGLTKGEVKGKKDALDKLPYDWEKDTLS